MRSRNVILFAAIAIGLGSCGLVRDQTDSGTVSVRGVQPTLEQLNVTANRNAQDAFVQDLIHKAGFPAGKVLQPRDPDWALVMEAGVYEIGRQCDQYLDALFRFNREQRAGRQGLAATAAATGSVMGLAGLGATAIAITAAAFGLTASLFEASVNSVLFTIEPSALRNVVLQGREKYLEGLKTDRVEINSRPRMMIALQGYLTQCSPAAIEANINNAASGAPSVASRTKGEPEKAANLAAPGRSLLTRSAAVVAQPVIVNPPPLPPESLAANRGPGEENISSDTLKRVQAALGVFPDGDFGKSGTSKTREALLAFQQGMHVRDPAGWPPNEQTGALTGRSARTLTLLAAMPRLYFSNAFERALLGNHSPIGARMLLSPDAVFVDGVLVQLGVAANEIPAEPGAKMLLMRDRIKARHPERTEATLDAELYARLAAGTR